MSSQCSPSASPGKPTSDRVRLRRKRERGSYDRSVIDARCEDIVYCHGSTASRTMKAMATGAPICLTVTLVDGLVLARSAMHHSANYRSVMLMGEATPVLEPEEKMAAFETILERIVPGRWDEVRHPSENELKATAVVALAIDEASAKVRTGPPLDDEEDYAIGSWAGVIPISLRAATPQPDPLLAKGIALPSHIGDYRRPGSP
jgi:nitroimidazol reductase NimA-like FMN-containing flavoprotein (pyridoxamine 5'-phosphate oxidase superfamily)